MKIKEIFKNCLDVKEKDGWLAPVRFADERIEKYLLREPRRVRAMAPSGIYLGFTTASKTISFKYRITGKSREWAWIDVLFGGVLHESIELSSDEGALTLSLPGDESVPVSIYLPHLVVFELSDINSECELVPTPKKEKLWLALGDSITQGMVATRPSRHYTVLLAEKFGCDLINQGIGGLTFVPDDIVPLERYPDVVTVALGTNDWVMVSEGGVYNDAKEYLSRVVAAYPKSKIYGIVPIWRNDEQTLNSGVNFAEHREKIFAVYREFPEITLIDGYDLVPHDSSLYGDPSETRVHPSEQGFEHYAKNLVLKGFSV